MQQQQLRGGGNDDDNHDDYYDADDHQHRLHQQLSFCVSVSRHVTFGLQDSDSDVQRVQQLQGVSYDKVIPLTPSNTTH